uniref:Uncharacterized protein n=1 Tax=Ditylenchus dipsaci TaxID=166011 RepID=A0A915CPW9_9BILA
MSFCNYLGGVITGGVITTQRDTITDWNANHMKKQTSKNKVYITVYIYYLSGELSTVVVLQAVHKKVAKNNIKKTISNREREFMNQRNNGDLEEQRWAHYTEYVFYREPQYFLLGCPFASSSPIQSPRNN